VVSFSCIVTFLGNIQLRRFHPSNARCSYSMDNHFCWHGMFESLRHHNIHKGTFLTSVLVSQSSFLTHPFLIPLFNLVLTLKAYPPHATVPFYDAYSTVILFFLAYRTYMGFTVHPHSPFQTHIPIPMDSRAHTTACLYIP
jgi:hypothetical protein